MGGNEVWSLGITFRQPKRRRTGTSDVARDLDDRGDQAFYWNSLLRYTRNWVMIRSILVSPISPVPHYGNRPKLVSLESYDHGESNAVGCKDFGSELAEDVGIYRETIKGAQIRNIGAFLSWKLLSSSSSSFVVTPPSVLGRFQWCLG